MIRRFVLIGLLGQAQFPHAQLWADVLSAEQRRCPKAHAMLESVKRMPLRGKIIDPIYISAYRTLMTCRLGVTGPDRAMLDLSAAAALNSSRFDNRDPAQKRWALERQRSIASEGLQYALDDPELTDMLKYYRDHNVPGF